MEFIDLKAQQARIRPEIERRMQMVLDHGKYIMGPEVGELEERLADYASVKHSVAVSSGTDALLIALMALDIGPGDEVITTPFSFIATAEVIALLGATPVFVDIDKRTYNIDPTRIESAITPRTCAILPVSLYGQCADMDAINAIADKHGLPVIEDAAQSFGATYKGGKSCALSTIGCTSFFPSKPLGGYGDSGACFTSDAALVKKMREIRVHGQDRRYHHPIIGLNGRMDTLQAAILLAKLAIFPQEVAQRQVVGRRYDAYLTAHEIPETPNARVGAARCVDQSQPITTPHIEPHNTSVYAQYTIGVNDRPAVERALHDAGIPTAVHYPVPLYRQPAFAAVVETPAAYPNTERVAERVLSLPMHPYVHDADHMRIAEALTRAFTRHEHG